MFHSLRLFQCNKQYVNMSLCIKIICIIHWARLIIPCLRLKHSYRITPITEASFVNTQHAAYISISAIHSARWILYRISPIGTQCAAWLKYTLLSASISISIHASIAFLGSNNSVSLSVCQFVNSLPP